MLRDFLAIFKWVTSSNYTITFFQDKTDDGGVMWFMGNVKGIILAGGQGKRFRPLTYYFQKCMIPVGEEQKPVLEYIIRLFTHHNIKDLVVLVGYKNQQVKNYFNNGSRFGANIKYVLDEPEYKGNAGAIVNAYRRGDILEDDRIHLGLKIPTLFALQPPDFSPCAVRSHDM